MCFDVHVFECECMLFLFRCDDNLMTIWYVPVLVRNIWSYYKLPAVLSRDLARFGLFGEAEIWSHDSFPNLICKILGVTSKGFSLKSNIAHETNM